MTERRKQTTPKKGEWLSEGRLEAGDKTGEQSYVRARAEGSDAQGLRQSATTLRTAVCRTARTVV